MLKRLLLLLVSLVWGNLFFLFSQLAATADPLPSQIVQYKQVGEVSLTLHVFTPDEHKTSDCRPAIVFFFGGGWNGGTTSQFYPQSAHLAKRGMVAICADYRVRSRHKTPPSVCVEDGKSAMRYVRAHASELGIDPNRIAAGGGSAGGHVATATATVDRFDAETDDFKVSCRPDALVLFNPVYDNGPEGYGHDRVKSYWEDFSPLHNLDKDVPPTFVVLGTKDKLIPVSTAKAFKQRMNELGVRSELHLFQGQAHGFFNKLKYEETLRAADAFLVSLGYLKAAAESE